MGTKDARRRRRDKESGIGLEAETGWRRVYDCDIQRRGVQFRKSVAACAARGQGSGLSGQEIRRRKRGSRGVLLGCNGLWCITMSLFSCEGSFLGTFALFMLILVYINHMGNTAHINQYFVGPLNIDRRTKQATTAMGMKLSLSAGEFDALDILAEMEDTPLSFERLCSELRDKGNGSSELETAKLMLDSLSRQVNEAGEGFMWIEYDPEKGYTFKTHWGHNWHPWNAAYEKAKSERDDN